MPPLPDFRSDNRAPALEAVVRAVAEDHATARRSGFTGTRFLESELDAALGARFETALEAVPVVTGTAANALALTALVPADGVIFCHEQAHIRGWEADAYAFYSRGTRLVALPGADARIDIAAARAAIADFRQGEPAARGALSLTQSTERGTLYRPEEIRALCDIAHTADLGVHMDGARFSQAVAALQVRPAALSCEAGVDILSLGTSKLGSLCAEAVVIFARATRAGLADTVKRAGHKLSKRRDLAVQILAMLEGDRFIEVAGATNRLARRLGDGLAACGLALANPVETNQIFVHIPPPLAQALSEAGLPLLEWTEPGLYRFVTAHHHTDGDADRVVDTIRRCAGLSPHSKASTQE